MNPKYVALQEGREGLLGSGTCQWGLFWKSQTWLGWRVFSLSTAWICASGLLIRLICWEEVEFPCQVQKKDTFVFLRKKNKVFMDLGVKITRLTGLTLVKG